MPPGNTRDLLTPLRIEFAQSLCFTPIAMRARTRSRLLRLSLITTVVGIVALFTPFHDDWIMILKASLLLGAFALAMVWAVTKSMGDVQAPDILAQHITSEGGFDANGLTLLPHFEVID